MKSEGKSLSVWRYMIYVSLSIVLIIGVSNFVFNLVTERSGFIETEKVANETYKKYSQRLDTISEMYAKEIEATKEKS
jgi:hypothetical protein